MSRGAFDLMPPENGAAPIAAGSSDARIVVV